MNTSPWLALAVPFIFVLLIFGFIAAQFTVMAIANFRDNAVQASIPQQVLAWLEEGVVVIVVFFWSQAWRPNKFPDYLPPSNDDDVTSRGIVLLHGLFCNRGLWNPWFCELKSRKIPFIGVNLEPVFGSIDGYVPIVDKAVRRMVQATGKPPLLVCHSMGGLAARAWLRASGGRSKVHHVVTIGSPHRGTRLGKIGGFSRCMAKY